MKTIKFEGGYLSISTLLKTLEENNGDPEESYLEVKAFEDVNDYGEGYVSKTMILHLSEKK